VTLPAAGTYFMAIDLANSGINLGDTTFATRAVKEAGVATIPFSAFYETPPDSALVRLCFAKSDDTLDRGVDALAKARRLLT
jgi:aspartate/methionine/tyrosine aminotransferase